MKILNNKTNDPPAHVQLCDGDCDIVDGEPALKEQILSHVGQRRGGVDGVPTHPVTLQVGGGVPPLNS